MPVCQISVIFSTCWTWGYEGSIGWIGTKVCKSLTALPTSIQDYPLIRYGLGCIYFMRRFGQTNSRHWLPRITATAVTIMSWLQAVVGSRPEAKGIREPVSIMSCRGDCMGVVKLCSRMTLTLALALRDLSQHASFVLIRFSEVMIHLQFWATRNFRLTGSRLSITKNSLVRPNLKGSLSLTSSRCSGVVCLSKWRQE